MADKTIELKEKFAEALSKVSTMEDLENLRVEYTGKKGYITGLMQEMKNLSPEEKKTFGQMVNVLKDEVNEKITEKREELKNSSKSPLFGGNYGDFIREEKREND